MKNLGHYAKKFLIGMAIGAGVFTTMSLFGGLGVLTFAAPNPLTSFIYATLFFGAINTSGAIMNDLFSPPAPTPTPTAAQPALTRASNEKTMSLATTTTVPASHVARLQATQSEITHQR